MIYNPLTSIEQSELNKALKKVKSIDINADPDFEVAIITISPHNKDVWLAILNMATRANELMEDKWRSSGPKGNDVL